MKTPTLFLLLLTIFSSTVIAQEQSAAADTAIVQSVEITGIPEENLSDAVREDMDRLVGLPYDETAADAIADRIQTELPEYVAAARTISGAEEGRVRLIFVVGRIADDAELESNINARYTVEAVEMEGLPQADISDELQAELQSMVGERLDQDLAERLRERLATELGTSYRVIRRVSRGTVPEQVKVVYEVRVVPWLRFQVVWPYVVYHSKQGFSISGHIPIEIRETHKITFGGANSQDELLERFAGYRVGFESLHLGTPHLGLSLKYSSYRAQWAPQTLLAAEQNPQIPGIYRVRRTFEPSLAFAFNRDWNVTAGVSLVELEMQSPELQSESARAAVGELRYRREPVDNGHGFEGTYTIRAATDNLSSDFVYTSHVGAARYSYVRDQQRVSVDFMAGRIAGNAPLFERFSLGDTVRLRGWNKFDVAPLGGNRVVYASLDYRVHVLNVFYDTGSVWENGQPAVARHAVGFGLRARDNASRKGWFVNLGIPIRDAGIEALFSAGVRF